MGILSDEELSRSSCRMRDAAESAARSADRVEEAVRKIEQLLGTGYGNNVEMLLQKLDEVKIPEPQEFKQEVLATPWHDTSHPAYAMFARLFVTLTDAFEKQFEQAGLHRVMEASSIQMLRRHAETVDVEFTKELRRAVHPTEFQIEAWIKHKRTEQEIRERNATNKRRSLTVPMDS